MIDIMQVYKTKVKKFAGTDFREVHKRALGLYTEIKTPNIYQVGVF